MKTLSFFITLSMLLFTGCVSSSEVETLALIWIEGAQGGPIYNHMLFEIRADGTIKLFEDNVYFDIETKEVYTGENTKTRMLHVKKADEACISKLINEIGDKRADIVNPINDISAVYASINEKLYWTAFLNEGDSNIANRELLELTQVLLNIANIGTG